VTYEKLKEEETFLCRMIGVGGVGVCVCVCVCASVQTKLCITIELQKETRLFLIYNKKIPNLSSF
jgi:hypothetical protein